MSASSRPSADAVVVLDRELDRLDAPEVGLVERRPGPGLHACRDTCHARDRLDRMTEEVCVVHACAPAETAHLLAQAALDERVHHHGGPAARAGDGELEVVDRLDAWMAHFLEGEVGELRLEREHEPRGRLTGRVGDDVQLDGNLAGHRREATPERPPVFAAVRPAFRRAAPGDDAETSRRGRRASACVRLRAWPPRARSALRAHRPRGCIPLRRSPSP